MVQLEWRVGVYQDSLTIKVSKPSLALVVYGPSAGCLFPLLRFLVNDPVLFHLFILSQIVLSETKCSFQSETRALHLACKKTPPSNNNNNFRAEFTNFVQNKLRTLHSQILSISIAGAFARETPRKSNRSLSLLK